MARKTRVSETWRNFVRDRRGDTPQGEFGSLFGVRGSYVSEWERLGIVPSQPVVARGAEALGDDLAPWLAAAGYSPDGQLAGAVTPVADLSDYRPPPLVGSLGEHGIATLEGSESPVGTYRVKSPLGSMFQLGDLVVIEPPSRPEPGDYVLLRADGLLRLVRVAGLPPDRPGHYLVEPVDALGLNRPVEVQGEVLGIAERLIRPLRPARRGRRKQT